MNMYLQVGETGHTVGVEHIPELVKRSIDAIKQTPAGDLMDKGRIVVHGKQRTSQFSPHCSSLLKTLQCKLVITIPSVISSLEEVLTTCKI